MAGIDQGLLDDLAGKINRISGPNSALTTGDNAWMKSAPRKYHAYIQGAAARESLSPALLAALIKVESNFNARAGSGAGAKGLTQLMPETAASLGVKDVYDPQQSINGGAKYLRQQLNTFDGNTTLALAAYNAGPGAVQKAGNKVPNFTETKNYVKNVQRIARSYGWKGTENPIDDPDDKNTLEQIGGTVEETADTIGTGINAIAGAVEDITAALFNPSTYLRGGKAILGILLLLLGAWALFTAYKGSLGPIPTTPKAPVPR